MKVWISIDMEGISGIVDRDQLMPTGMRYPLAREYMLGDLSAVLRALQAETDVESIVVNDSHDGMLNILWDRIPEGVTLISGGAKAWSMNQGVEEADLALYVGYHAMAGATAAIMDHTYSGEIYSVTINGQPVGETGINAAVAGHFGVPVGLVTGDDKVSEEARALLPGVETSIVKWGISRRSAKLLSRREADGVLEAGVHQALDKYRRGLLEAWKVKEPVELEVGVMTPEMADRAMYIPGARRVDGRTVGFTEPNILEAFRAFYMVMASADRPLY